MEVFKVIIRAFYQTDRRIYFFIDMTKKTVLLTILITSLILTGLVPAGSMFNVDYNSCYYFLEEQPAAQYFSAFSMLPLKLLNILGVPQAVTATSQNKKSPKEQDREDKDSDFLAKLLVTRTIRNSRDVIKYFSKPALSKSDLTGSFIHSFDDLIPSVHQTTYLNSSFTPMFILMAIAIILLPRGSIDDYIKTLQILKSPTRI